MFIRVVMRVSSTLMTVVGTLVLSFNLSIPIMVGGFIYITGVDKTEILLLLTDVKEALPPLRDIVAAVAMDCAFLFWLGTALAAFYADFDRRRLWVCVLFGTFSVVFTAIPLFHLPVSLGVALGTLALPVLFLVSSLSFTFLQGES